MASAGVRIGSLPELKLKHLKRCQIDDNLHIYQIQVYTSSKKYTYKTFCTPECAQAIDKYLEYRKKVDKSLSFNTETEQWVSSDPNTLLISKLFDIDDVPSCSSSFKDRSKKPIDVMGIRAYIVDKLKKLNMRQTWTSIESSRHAAIHKNELHSCHSLRLFAVTNMQRSKVDKTIREMLIGHSTGLDSVYYKPQDDEILQEYKKAIDALTINNEHRLKKQIQEFEVKNKENEFLVKTKLQERDEEIRALKQKHESDLKSFEDRMESRFQQLLTITDLQKLK